MGQRLIKDKRKGCLLFLLIDSTQLKLKKFLLKTDFCAWNILISATHPSSL